MPKRSRICLNVLDCQGITHLMQNGFSLPDALELLETSENELVFLRIREKLEQGIPASQFFAEFFPSKWRSYFNGLIQFTNFSDSLALCNAIMIGQQKQRQEYVKALSYPFAMLLATYGGIVLFNTFCFPALIAMTQSFQMEMPSLGIMHRIIQIVCIVLFLLFLISCFFLLFCLQKAHIIQAYQWIARRNPHSMLVQYVSNEFIFFFLQCVQKHISTRNALQMMQALSNKPILTYLAQELEHSFLHGVAFAKAMQMPWIDPLLYKYMKIALYSSNMEQMLEGYLEISKENITRKAKRMTRLIQLLSYTSIGIILILVYQILMLPLQLLSQI